jgi:hypothetical protein
MTMPDTESILSELKDYLTFRDLNPGFRLSEYAWYKLTPDLLISTMAILWPKLIMRNGGVFFEEGFSEEVFHKWLAHFNGDVHEAERLMNHQHVRDLIQSENRLPDSVIRYLGEALVCFWQAAINSQFPNLSIVVKSNWDTEINDVVVLVYQNATPKVKEHGWGR